MQTKLMRQLHRIAIRVNCALQNQKMTWGNRQGAPTPETKPVSVQEELMPLTRRQEIMLAATSAVPGAAFAPVQVQKLFFLLDENVSPFLGGPHFAFVPYDYGPFDKNVYREFEGLAHAGLANIGDAPGARRRVYSLTSAGQEVGTHVLAQLPAGVREYIKQLAAWILSVSFAELVGTIYREYPRMRENSIFQD